ncbi:MAG: hypothetical protein LBB34_02055 [Holosporales bacterium]|jgi:hypothetical protein|nr:hypothetical protein [Holosporales bacterium]
MVSDGNRCAQLSAGLMLFVVRVVLQVSQNFEFVKKREARKERKFLKIY